MKLKEMEEETTPFHSESFPTPPQHPGFAMPFYLSGIGKLPGRAKAAPIASI